MATSLSVVVSMMTPDGLAVGECHRVDESELWFFTTARISPGLELEFRLELDGADVTVLGFMRVVSGAGPLRWRAAILHLHPDDRRTWEAWHRARREGRMVYLGHTAGGGGLLGEQAGRSQTAANKLALDRMEERRQRHAHLRSDWKDDGDDLFVDGAFDMAPIHSLH